MKNRIKIILIVISVIILITVIVGIKVCNEKKKKDIEFQERLSQLNIEYKTVLEILRSKRCRRINKYF